MKLYFQNRNGKERLIAEVKDGDDAYMKIKEFCNERGFKIYYTRCWKRDNVVVYDVGSHTEFFLLKNE